jgi:hypothetical protein
MTPSQILLQAAEHVRKADRLLDSLSPNWIKRIERSVPGAQYITSHTAERLEALTDGVKS